MQLQFVRHLTLDQPSASGYRHFAAASGLAAAGRWLYVIGDDELHLASFPAEGDAPGQLIRLFPGSLPRDPSARKAVKPDLEVLASLPPATAYPHGALLALGSGSTARRRSGALVTLDAEGAVESIRQLEVSGLFRAIARLVDQPNIEGAVVRDDQLLLFNRGNRARPDNLVLACSLADVTDGKTVEVIVRARLKLDTANDVPLTVTDACSLGDRILFSAVAEDTSNAYEDGKLIGTAVGALDANLNVVHLERVDHPVKIEGIQAWTDGDKIALLLVSDADNPTKPAGLFKCLMVKP
ncbi:MAG: hypothetical protein ABWY13_15655 [Mesorhizobium sp.]|jgi:hypothetical protein